MGTSGTQVSLKAWKEIIKKWASSFRKRCSIVFKRDKMEFSPKVLIVLPTPKASVRKPIHNRGKSDWILSANKIVQAITKIYVCTKSEKNRSKIVTFRG